MRFLVRAVVLVLALVGASSIAGLGWFWWHGIGTRDEPSALETSVARRARQLAVPAHARALANPVPPTPEVIREGLEHWADHCASCHANDGSGDTDVGRALYPRAPDMRAAATQDLTDGELFYLIENGVKLTGMPAWGTATPEGEEASWGLVHFIRKLPELTEDDLALMAELNPRSAAEWQALEEERKFLAGETDAPAVAPSAAHKGGHQ